MLEKLKEVLFVIELYKGKESYYHCIKELEGEGNYTKEYKCKYCKYSMIDGRCEYYSCKGELKIC